jgi:hypothetical protein
MTRLLSGFWEGKTVVHISPQIPRARSSQSKRLNGRAKSRPIKRNDEGRSAPVSRGPLSERPTCGGRVTPPTRLPSPGPLSLLPRPGGNGSWGEWLLVRAIRR